MLGSAGPEELPRQDPALPAETAAAQRRRPGRSPVPTRRATAVRENRVLDSPNGPWCLPPACLLPPRPAPAGARLLSAAGTAADNRSADYAHGQCRGTAAPGQPGDLMSADAIGPGLRQRPGDPQTLELGHPLLVHQTLNVVDGFVAGLHRSSRQPGLSSEHHAGKGDVSSHEVCGLGAGNGKGNMRRSRQPRHAPRPGTLMSCWPGR